MIIDIKQTHTHIIGVPVGGEREKRRGKIFEEILVKNSQIWWKSLIHTSKKLNKLQLDKYK